FFGKKPLQRIKVSLMGPLVNLVFAFLVFLAIWGLGGRDKPFNEFTKKIGYIDHKSELYDLKVRPGDEIVKYNNKKYTGFRDILYSSVTSSKQIEIEGYKINYLQNKKAPFDYTLNTYPLNKDFSTIGIKQPAGYLIYDKELTSQGSPVIKNSGIESGDRLLWANGELLFSDSQLSEILNSNRAFLTVQRDDQVFHTNINLVKIADLKLSSYFKNELDDYRYFSNIKTNLNDLNIIPYHFDEDGEIIKSLNFIDESKALSFLNSRNAYSVALKKGDKILTIGGDKITNGSNILTNFQNPKILLIAQRDPKILTKISYKEIDKDFDKNLDIKSLNQIVKYIGTNKQILSSNNLHLLKPIEPMSYKTLAKIDESFAKNLLLFQQNVEAIKDPVKKAEALTQFDYETNKKILGISLERKIIKYNPNPVQMFSDGFTETIRTFVGLITGLVSPKHLAGPIGIVHVVKISWSQGPLEALYWLGFISLNLGFLNLLPVPVLDGGHIVFSIVEMITKKPIKAKTMERLTIPFVVLLIGGIIFVTFHDILRIVNNFF
nr:putative zinc metalloprotease [Candidatus Anoxychlamydiales bacterium]